MGLLGEPIYELKKDTDYYKKQKAYRDMLPELDECLKAVNKEYGFSKLGVWDSKNFALKSDDVKFGELRSLLKVDSNQYGDYKFKKTGPLYKEIKSKLGIFDKSDKLNNRFVQMDVMGFNNVKAAHWVNNRWFFETRFQEPERMDLVDKVELKDYLDEVLKMKENKNG